jgi:4-alpha-glucanotransferase
MRSAGEEALEDLFARCGIAAEFHDYKQELVQLSREARAGVLRCLGHDARAETAGRTLAALDRRRAELMLPEVLMLQVGQALECPVRHPTDRATSAWRLRIDCEDGSSLEPDHRVERAVDDSLAGQQLRRERWFTDATLPAGYHRLALVDATGEELASSALLVVPPFCFQPPVLERGGRVFGISVQLYTVRSARNWGMGDFGDLAALVEQAAASGVDLVGLNPLHALFPANPLHFSPYSPSNRAFLNVMYIDVEAVAEFADSEAARRQAAEPAFQARLAELRAVDRVDYAGVAACKMPVLELLFEEFRRRHLDGGSPRGRAFRAFVADQGEALRRHALYDALHEHFFRRDFNLWGWPVWPEGYRSPDGSGALRFAREHPDRVDFYLYLQWLARQQLDAAQRLALDSGMRVGIYLDIAVGIDASGSEAWSNRELFCLEASAGAPPDALARGGQDWGFPPMRPDVLRACAYEPFIATLRANMAMAGAVRYDHAVSLLRLWWIPHGVGADLGAYVNYRLDELLGLLALESHRNQCLVIGEDLGTVPRQLTREMLRHHAYSYRVLYFETDAKTGRLLPPEAYPAEAVATVSTHDLPTLASWWDGSDLDLRAELGLLKTEEIHREMLAARVRDRQHMIDALRQSGLWQRPIRARDIPVMTRELNGAVHRFLARSRSRVMIAQIEDLLGMLDPVNVPGTFQDHPNWQRKLTAPVEGLLERPDLRRLLELMADERGDSGAGLQG